MKQKALASQARSQAAASQSQPRNKKKGSAAAVPSSDLNHVTRRYPKFAESVSDLDTVRQLFGNFLKTFGDKWTELDEAIAKSGETDEAVAQVEKAAKRFARTLDATRKNLNQAAKVDTV